LVIDLEAAIPRDKRYFYDFIHLNNEGSERAAGTIFDSLLPSVE
jgi:hypothetical protein